MDRLNLLEPFFVNITGRDRYIFGYDVNNKVVPFVIEMGQDGPNPIQRFINGEVATNGDSGLVGLVAASAPIVEKQAQLYTSLAKAIIDIHQKRFINSDRPTLLETWYKAQSKPNRKNNVMDSLAIFEIHDHDRETSELRPENERLLKYNENNEFEGLDLELWRGRIKQLQNELISAPFN